MMITLTELIPNTNQDFSLCVLATLSWLFVFLIITCNQIAGNPDVNDPAARLKVSSGKRPLN